MKARHNRNGRPALRVVDQCKELSRELLEMLQAVAASPRHRIGLKWSDYFQKKVGPLVLWDWRHVAARYLRRRLPSAYIYLGGRHVAIHECSGGPCLARIIEEGK